MEGRIDPTTGKRWNNTWEPEEFITDDLIAEFYATTFGIKPVFSAAPIDVRPLYLSVALSVARAVTLGRTARRPHVHTITLDCLKLWSLATAFPEIRCADLVVLGKSQLKIETTEISGFVTKTLKLKLMSQIAAFCSFERFIDERKAIGALNFDVGRDSNVDCNVVGSEMLITISQMKKFPELCTAMVQFPTVKINGIFGTFDYPPMSRGVLKEQKNRDALIAYVKSVLPDAHPLSRKGCASCHQGRARCRTRSRHRAPPPLQPRRPAKAAPKGGKGKGRKRPRLGDAQEEHEVAVATAVFSASA
jgi:hypothetical protein